LAWAASNVGQLHFGASLADLGLQLLGVVTSFQSVLPVPVGSLLSNLGLGLADLSLEEGFIHLDQHGPSLHLVALVGQQGLDAPAHLSSDRDFN
jgi:hypothetical protein